MPHRRGGAGQPIVDDLKHDDQLRTATWGMTLAPDVTLVDNRSVGTGVEAVLGEATPEAVPRHLLVRMVDMGTPAVRETIRQPNPPKKNREIPKLSIRTTGRSRVGMVRQGVTILPTDGR